VLPWREEECSVDERISVEDVHDVFAEDAGHPVHLVAGVTRQYENPRLVVPDAALVFHLDVV